MECFYIVTVGWVFSLCLHEFAHAWVAYRDSTTASDLPAGAIRPLESTLIAPDQPGFYRLALIHGAERSGKIYDGGDPDRVVAGVRTAGDAARRRRRAE